MTAERLIEHKHSPSTCRICGKCFANETDLVTHELTAHPNVGDSQPQGKPPSKNDKAA
jgi:hypothetical protein